MTRGSSHYFGRSHCDDCADRYLKIQARKLQEDQLLDALKEVTENPGDLELQEKVLEMYREYVYGVVGNP